MTNSSYHKFSLSLFFSLSLIDLTLRILQITQSTNMEALSPADVSTHYYKIGHINSVRYAVFQLAQANDQALLELELAIRFKYPNILLTYYNKGLYYFQFAHNPDSIDLEKEYPELFLKDSNTVLTENFLNPTKSSSGTNSSTNSNSNTNANPTSHATPGDDSKPSEQTSSTKTSVGTHGIGIGLLKAIKKLIIFRLSRKKALRIFGNYCVVSVNEISNIIVYIDPMMLPNGDLLLCMIQKTNLELFNSNVLPIDNPDSDINSNFVIYLNPSGIRCHLYDSLKILNSFTYTAPKNAENVLDLLKLATGIDLSEEQNLLWVKLIPNLQHLNNQVSKISKFVHSVDNKKYILWPWKLCLLQFGKFEKTINLRLATNEQANSTTNDISADPLDLISEFMDFRITTKQQIQLVNHNHNSSINTAPTHPAYSIPSVMSTGMSSTDHKNDMPVDVNDMSLMPDLFNGTPNNDLFDNGVKMMNHMDNLGNHEDPDNLKLNDSNINKDHSDREGSQDDDEMDDLFGDDDEEDGEENEDDKNDMGSNQQDAGENQNIIDDSVLELDNQQNPDVLDESGFDFISNQDDTNEFMDRKSFKQEIPSFDIPKDQMALSMADMKNPTPYDDPGAPLPIMPTPIVPPSADRSRLHSSGFDSDTSSKSAFSPIVFNPLIRSNIDNKYGKGGKFYVDKESRDHENNFPKLRATSVTGFELRSIGDDNLNKGLGIDFGADSKVFSDSDDNEKEEDADGSDNSDSDNNNESNNEAAMEDDDEEEEESDEDADINLGKHSPLKLNTQSEPSNFQNPSGVAPAPPMGEVPGSARPQHQNIFNMTSMNTGGFSSPLSNTLAVPSSRMTNLPKFDSPFAVHDSPIDERNKFSSPLSMEHDEIKRRPSVTSAPATASTTTPAANNGTGKTGSVVAITSGPTTNNKDSRSGLISESANCLPLILRGVNTATIPNDYLLNNIAGAIKMSASASDFNMDVDQDDEDYEVGRKNEMAIKVDNLNEFLSWLGPNLVFDLGLNNFNSNLITNIPNANQKEEAKLDHLIDGESISKSFEEVLTSEFPLCYKIKLDEFLSDLVESTKDRKIENELDNQLSFLDDITNDEILNPKSKIKKLDFIEWDSIYMENDKNEDSFRDYLEVLNDIKYNSILDSEGTIKSLEDNKIRVLKNKQDIVNLNSISIRFWKQLKVNPISGPKNFQVLLISETANDVHSSSYNQEFLDSLIFNYTDCNLGNVSKLSLQTLDTRPDLESINNGLMMVNNQDDNYNLVYKSINKKLSSLVELIKLDLINKTNRFEFDRPLLLMVLNFNENINSALEISKICRNFKMILKRHQLPLVEVFCKMIPANFVIKTHNQQRYLRYLSNYTLTRLSMNLYNQCPTRSLNSVKAIASQKPEVSLNLFTHIVKDPLSKINFKFFNHAGMNKDYSNDDAFLHLAYERSIDKNWVSAAWSDPSGVVTHTKSWCNAANVVRPSSHPQSNNPNHNGGNDINNNSNRNIHDLQSISDQIFDISNDLFKKLNEAIIKRTSGLGGRKFLVLTRINSIIPDEELIHWKRLSMKFKDVSLIVLSVNSLPKLLFSDESGGSSKTSGDINPDRKQTMSGKPNIPGMDFQGLDMDGGSHNSNNVEGSMINNSNNSQFNTNIIGMTIDEQLEFNNEDLNKQTNHDPTSDFFKTFNGLTSANDPSPSNSNLMTSPSANFNFGINGANNFFSPDGSGTANNKNEGDLFLNNTRLKDMVLQDPLDQVTGIIPKASVPSFNCPTRAGMKVGILIKKLTEQKPDYLVFEINLLSCSNYWNLDSLMKVILNHYRKLITLNDILGTRSMDNNFGTPEEKQSYAISGLIPWHIAAVSKSLNYLVHIDVEE